MKSRKKLKKKDKDWEVYIMAITMAWKAYVKATAPIDKEDKL